KLWILLPALVLAAGAYALATTETERFRASGEILIGAPTSEGIPYLDGSISDNADRTIQNEIELLESRDTVDRVEEEVGRDLTVTATNSGDSDVITLQSENESPVQAAEDVNDFANAYVELRRSDRRNQLEAARSRVVADRRSAQEALVSLNAPIRAIEAELEGTPPGPERDQLIAERDAARDDSSFRRTALNNQITTFAQTIDQIDGAIQLSAGGIRVITEATPPSERFTPQPNKDALVAACIGLLLGLLLAFAVEFAFDAVSSPEEIEQVLPHDLFLGAIPELDDELGESATLDFGTAASTGAEAYRALAASIEFARLEKPVSVIHITSPVQGEGKSSTAANLAIAFAESGARVAMVDADVRRPQLYRTFGADNAVGLSGVLLGRIAIDEALQEVPGVPGAHLLSPGELPQNPTKLLYARRTEEVFADLRTSFDVVLVDGPPVLPVADALILAQFADLTVLVVRAGATRRRALRRARHALGRVDASSVAVVLNGVARTGPDGYGYYGRYYHDGDVDRRRGLRSLVSRRR
ncbi:MAG TPA: polysaccharide biosynthesis tyrosine autokinase, partial [Acidimicrobiales bacterium]|nr:polysaccharide biosynthesis tyrosine autokinase [Acidimicrobiales bacterium]